jgi:arylsulfatase A-like enzyme
MRLLRSLSLILGLCFLCAPVVAMPQSKRDGAQRRPNIVLILADDLGWTDLECYGSRFYETPHIDRLAREGMRFTDAYTAAAQCAPTRASLMTGRDIGRHGIWAVDRLRGQEKFRKMIPPENEIRLPLREVTVADALRQAGYRTGMSGKWHLGLEDQYLPSNRGFDEAITFPEEYRYFGFSTRPAITVGPQTYLTDFLTDRAIEFIEANKTRPFFLYLPHYAVHSPLRAKEDLIARYRMKKPAGGHRDPVYAAMIHSIDEGVGRIMARLKELDLDERTVVIFYSDNGGAGGYERDGVEWFSPTSNHPLRGGKGMLYEGGVRVPLIVRWPGVVAPGSICSEPVTSTDFFPTFLTLAGRETDRNRPVDGLSLVPLLQKGGTASLHREALFWHYPSYLQANAEKGTWRITPAGAIRSGDFKLLEFFEDGRLELYDLRNDIGETRNLALQMPAKAKELHQKLVVWRLATNAPMATPKPR